MDLLNRRARIRLAWMLSGVTAAMLGYLGGQFPEAAERIYGGFIYPGVRWVFRYSLGLLPFPALWVVVGFCLWLLYRTAIRPLRRRQWSWPSLVSGLLATVGAVIFLFYVLWGFNYGRPGVAQRMELEAPPIGLEKLRAEFERATAELVAMTDNYEDLLEGERHLLPSGLQVELHQGLGNILSALDVPTVPAPRARLLAPKGTLLVFNTAGIYIPFSGEGHVDAGMLPLQIPFTMAHELAHGYGITDEGECNFIAYLVCQRADDPQIRISGILSYWRYVASDYRRMDREGYDSVYRDLPEIIKTILQEIRENNNRYPEIMPQVRDRVYETYLKTHGVQEGLASYSTVVRLVHAYRQAGYPLSN